MDKILYGAAYYDEYMPYDRLDKDVEMMKRAGINLVRIAESTWSTLEPSDGEFNFYHIDRVLNAMEKSTGRSDSSCCHSKLFRSPYMLKLSV